MAKIQRYQGNLQAFASNEQTNERAVFGTLTTGVDDITANIGAEYLRGWGTLPASENPPKEWFNGLAYTISQIHAYIHQAGVPEYHAQQQYFVGSICQFGGALYRSLVGDDITPNVGNQPDLSAAQWKDIVEDATDQLGAVAFTNSYLDLDDLPTLGTAAARNVGTGLSNIPDNTQLNVRLGTTLSLAEAFGLGDAILVSQTSDLNDVLEYGDYVVATNAINAPITGTVGYLRVFASTSSGSLIQVYISSQNGREFRRYSADGATWSAWIETASIVDGVAGQKKLTISGADFSQTDYSVTGVSATYQVRNDSLAGLTLGTSSNHRVRVIANGVEQLSILPNGFIGVGIANPTGSLSNGDGVQFSTLGYIQSVRTDNPCAVFSRFGTAGDVLRITQNTSPVIRFGSAGDVTAISYNRSSDATLKRIKAPLDCTREELDGIGVYLFEWLDVEEVTEQQRGTEDSGVMAQEFLAIPAFKHCVHQQDNGKYTVDYGKAALIYAILDRKLTKRGE